MKIWVLVLPADFVRFVVYSLMLPEDDASGCDRMPDNKQGGNRLGIRILVDNRFEFPDIVFYICHLVIVELRQDKLGQDRFDILVGMREFLDDF